MAIVLWNTALAVMLMSAFISEKISAKSAAKDKICNCQEVQDKGGSRINGIYKINLSDNDETTKVYCDLEKDGGRWTIIQRRVDSEAQEIFDRSWDEYANGFGDVGRDFYLGNKAIHLLTNQKKNEIRINLQDFQGNHRFAKYSLFRVHNEGSSFKLDIEDYEGDAGDSFTYHNGMIFSTRDKDNDISDKHHCAKAFKAGWWFKKCYNSLLNGLYNRGNHDSKVGGVNWNSWHGNYSLKAVEMMIRPVRA